MFYYYGRKFRLAKLYPEPLKESNVIVEPFAGSAAYSLHGERWKKDVILYDTYDVVVKIWEYLINDATERDIEQLPILKKGDDLRKISYLSDVERFIIGFAINPGSTSPRNIVSNFSRWTPNKEYIKKNLYKVKHWSIFQKSYSKITENILATWFIDPPYQKHGIHYPKGGIDFSQLAVWCKERKGLGIVCEGNDGDWLPFSELTSMKGFQKRISKEKIWVGKNE